jgi:hypothetical protein
MNKTVLGLIIAAAAIIAGVLIGLFIIDVYSKKQLAGVEVGESGMVADDCKGITSDLERNSCYLFLARGSDRHEFCLEITDKYKLNDCLHELAVRQKNAKICLGTPDELALNRNICITEVAKKTLNEDDCGLIDDAEYRAKCLNEIAIRLQ